MPYLIWFFLLWLAFSYFSRGLFSPPRVTLSYSDFKNEVKLGQIKDVTFQGDKIVGAFNKKYAPPSAASRPGQKPVTYMYFTTEKPAIDDPDLITLLNNHQVNISAEPKSQNWFLYLVINLLPWVLIVGYFIYAGNRMQKQMKGPLGAGGGLFGLGASRARRYLKSDGGVRFRDVAGLENAKQDLMEIVDYLKEPMKFARLGARIPKGILLVGPPGCGKTLLARATAQEIGIPFFSISGSEFIEMFVGVGAQRVRDMFAVAKKEAPSIIFIDEIDSIGRSRSLNVGGGHSELEQTLNQILSEMDGFDPSDLVVVMAATNRPDVLDPALTRPGRFDRQIVVTYPQKKARREILRIHTQRVPLAPDVDLDNLAARTVGFSGAHLKNLVNEAALLAGRKNKEAVGAEDFEQARDKILLGEKTEEMMDENEKKMVAYHESGHALVAKILPGTDPLQKVSIIPRGMSLGATEQVRETDRHNVTKEYLLGLITVQLGGRSAEQLVFNTLTSGASSDLKQATHIARNMVCQLGMSDKLGPISVSQGEEHAFLRQEIAPSKDYSDHLAELIDDEIESILRACETRATQILEKNRAKLDALARELLEHETLDRSDIDRVLS